MTMNSLSPLRIHGGEEHGGGLLDAVAALLAAFDNITQLGAGELLALLLPGMATLDNAHPLFVHYPIAFLSAFFVVDVLGTVANKPGWRRLASGLLYLGALSALPTVISGLMAASTVAHGGAVHAIMERHRQIGLWVLALATILALWRLKWGALPRGAANNGFLVLAGLMCGLLLIGADLGGLMVYQFGVAVEAAPVPEDAIRHGH